MNKEHYIGIMSGTSMDSVDVVFCEINKKECKLLESIEYPFPQSLKEEITTAIENYLPLYKVGSLNQRLGILFTEAVNTLLGQYDIDPKTITAIGSHGQTVWHEPNSKTPFSMQLGNPSVIAANTRIPVIADFRSKDIALGGQGAPLAPAFHQFLFGGTENSVSVVNIGGMSNITVLDKPLLGYDTGCGNVLMDLWIGKELGKPYDKDGAWARSGKVHYPLLETMLEEPYFDLAYPKSTGREKFNEAWLQEHLKAHILPPEDVQRTLLELTAITISNEVLKFNKDILMLCGGGAQNSFLVERLAILMPNIQILIAQDADMLEAMMMAWLAYKRIHNEYVDLKEVTGARENGILGGIYL
jgi:anhydro-N-acetylmuramic acid kinase